MQSESFKEACHLLKTDITKNLPQTQKLVNNENDLFTFESSPLVTEESSRFKQWYGNNYESDWSSLTKNQKKRIK